MAVGTVGPEQDADRWSGPSRWLDVRRWSVDTEIFLDIADPVMLTDPGTANHPLIAERMAQAQLVAGWSLAFGGLLYETWRLPVRAWLLHAAQHPAQRSELIDVLVTAGAQRPGALARIYAMTREQALLTSRSATPPRASQTVSQGRISALAKRRCYRSIGSGAKHGLGSETSGRVPALGEHGPAGQVARGFPVACPGCPVRPRRRRTGQSAQLRLRPRSGRRRVPLLYRHDPAFAQVPWPPDLPE